ncbi:MAG: hypothetical protein IKQ44_05055 [Lachnospiraceae bacterium]|nr:hypothetical protein [Lachnospiraceae bacterium]
MKNTILKNVEILAFIFLFVGMFSVLAYSGDTDLHYDDALYWTLGQAYNWDCTNLAIGFRGYLLPFMFFLAYKLGKILGNQFIGLWILSGATFALLHTAVFRRIIGMLGFDTGDKKRTVICGGVAGCISALLFRGLYKYALSDIYAFTILLLTIIIFHDIISSENIGRIRRIISVFILGFMIYGMYNIRTIYLFISVILLGVFIVYHCLSKYRKFWYEVPVMIAGLFTGMYPMIRMNRALLGITSWQIPTDGLMLVQIHAGIYTDRYATYIGDKERFSSAGVYFYDKLGQKILEYEGIETLETWGEYIKLVFKYPLDFIGIYTRHLISMLYPIFPNQYIKSVDKDKSFFLILTFTLLWVCGIYLIKIYRFDKKSIILLITILFPCLCILPGAVESRFFFGVYYLIAAYVTMGIKEVFLEVKTKKVPYIVSYAVLFCIYVALCGYMLSGTESGTIILSGL